MYGVTGSAEKKMKSKVHHSSGPLPTEEGQWRQFLAAQQGEDKCHGI
jgi:hypothetical protein